MWPVDNLSSRVTVENSWQEVGRAKNSTHTNNSGGPRFVLVSVALNYGGSVNADDAEARLRLPSEGYTVGHTFHDGGLITSETARDVLMTLVMDGETYRVDDLSINGGSIDIEQWYEWDFDAVYSAQGYAHRGQPSLTKLNRYANGVNSMAQRDATHPHQATFTQNSTLDVTRFSNVGINVGAALTAGHAGVEQKDSGQALTRIAEISTPNSGRVTRTIPFFINDGGQWNLEVISGSPGVAADVNGSEIFQKPPAITFTSSADETKWTDLDQNASTGFNTTLDWTRTQSAGSSGTATSDTVTFIAAWIRFDPDATDRRDMELQVSGESNPLSSVSHKADSATHETMMFGMLNGGDQWSFDDLGTSATVVKTTTWEVQG